MEYDPFSDHIGFNGNDIWCCACRIIGGGHIICCSHCDLRWGHVSCYELCDKNKRELRDTYHICFACRNKSMESDSETEQHHIEYITNGNESEIIGRNVGCEIDFKAIGGGERISDSEFAPIIEDEQYDPYSDNKTLNQLPVETMHSQPFIASSGYPGYSGFDRVKMRSKCGTIYTRKWLYEDMMNVKGLIDMGSIERRPFPDLIAPENGSEFAGYFLEQLEDEVASISPYRTWCYQNEVTQPPISSNPISKSQPLPKFDINTAPRGLHDELLNKVDKHCDVAHVWVLGNALTGKALYLEFVHFEDIQSKISYELVSKLVDISELMSTKFVYKNRAKYFTERNIYRQAMVDLVKLLPTNNDFPPHIAMQQNGTRYATSQDVRLEYYCSNKMCAIIDNIDLKAIRTQKTYKKCKCRVKIKTEEIKNKRKIHSECATDEAKAKVTVSVTLCFPGHCLHGAYMDEKGTIRPFGHYYTHRGQKIADIEQPSHDIQTQQLKQISQKMRSNGNLQHCMSNDAVLARQCRTNKNEDRSANILEDFNNQRATEYEKNMHHFNRPLNALTAADTAKNRSELASMQTLHIASMMPIHFVVCPPTVLKQAAAASDPLILQIDWTGKTAMDIECKNLWPGATGSRKISKIKQSSFVTNYRLTDDARNGGGNLALLYSITDIATKERISECLQIMMEKLQRLFKKNIYDVFCCIMCDFDLSIWTPIIKCLYGAHYNIAVMTQELWALMLCNDPAFRKLLDLIICNGHFNKSIPRRLLRNLTEKPRQIQCKGIINELRLYQRLEQLEWASNGLQNGLTCDVIAKTYLFLLNEPHFDLSEDIQITNDYAAPWSDAAFDGSTVLSFEMECDDKTDNLGLQMARFITTTLEDFEAMSNDAIEIMSCAQCASIIKFKLATIHDNDFTKIVCPECQGTNYHYQSKSQLIKRIECRAGDITVSFIDIKCRKKDDLYEYIQYWDWTNVQFTKVFDEPLDPDALCPNLWRETINDKNQLKTSKDILNMIPMIVPCAQSKQYADEYRTNRTTQNVEINTKAFKGGTGNKCMPIQELISHMVGSMEDKRARYQLNVPRKHTRKKRRKKRMNNNVRKLIADAETPWDRNPGKDVILEQYIDAFRRQFGLKSNVEVCAKLNEMDVRISAIWLCGAINKLSLLDSRRKEVIDTIRRFVRLSKKKKKRKRSKK
eukprot:62542_1